MLADRFPGVLDEYRWTKKKIVLGVSGGVDSMVMADLFLQAGNPVLVAHANYGLRGEASEADEALVADWCRRKGVEMQIRHFPLQEVLDREGGNLQDIARVQRYEWFEEIRRQRNFDFIAVAHHQGDALETMLLNFFKGTGISGMHGILPRQGFVIRPLLSFSKEELLAYADFHRIPWRRDESNQTNRYLRNRIRNQLFPLLTALFPNVRENLAGNIRRLREVELLYQESIERYRKKLTERRGAESYISILKLRNCKPLSSIFFELVKPFGFSARQLPDLLHLLDAESGRFINSQTHRIVRDRSFLIITPLPTRECTYILIPGQPDTVAIDCPGFVLHQSIRMNTKPEALLAEARQHPHDAFIDLKRLEFPLICRPWKQGDYFYPLGLGKKKKISRFLIDQKVALPEKEKIWVLESRKTIVWVIGLRLDDRFKIKTSTKDIVHFSIS